VSGSIVPDTCLENGTREEALEGAEPSKYCPFIRPCNKPRIFWNVGGIDISRNTIFYPLLLSNTSSVVREWRCSQIPGPPRQGDGYISSFEDGKDISPNCQHSMFSKWMGVIAGVHYLHTYSPVIVHGDLKPVSGFNASLIDRDCSM
jgi:hypothetical protein